MLHTTYKACFGSSSPAGQEEECPPGGLQRDAPASDASAASFREKGFYVSNRQLIIFKSKEYLLLLDGIIHLFDQQPFSVGQERILADHLKKRGVAALRDLQGEFVVAGFDLINNRGLLAVSETGTAALFFSEEDGHLHFGNRLAEFGAVHGKGPEFGHLYALLGGRGMASGRTAYRGVERLLPGHYLLWEAGNAQTGCYSHLFRQRRRGWKGEAYTDFRQILERAVRLRLDPASNACALSSGLDSTAVSALAAEAIQGEQTLHGFTYRPEYLRDAQRRTPLDETILLASFYDRHPRIHRHEIGARDQGILESLRTALEVYGEPVYGASNQFWVQAMHRAMIAAGCGTMLTGQGGNFGISWPPPEWSRQGALSRIKVAWRIGQGRDMLLPYVSAAFYEQLEEERFAGAPLRLNLHAMQPFLLRNSISYAGFLQKQASLYHGLHVTDPTVDREVIDFCLAQSWRTYHDRMYSRKLVRKGLHDSLPREVLEAGQRGVQAADIQHRIAHERDAFMDLLGFLNKNNLVTFVFEINRLREDWESMNFLEMKRKDLNHLLRIILCGLFLSNLRD